MEEEDGCMSLNIVSHHQKAITNKVPAVESVSKEKDQRAFLKRKRGNRTESTEPRFAHRESAAGAPSSKKYKETHKGKIVSSLWRKNPHIPKVGRSTIKTVGEKIFSAHSFEHYPLHPFMISNLKDHMHLTQMTNVQKESIPVILEGVDTLIKSQTGSGKTLAYAIPIIQTLQGRQPPVSRSDGPYAIVIVPTRELAVQSFETFQKLVKPFVNIVPGCVMGGEKLKSEKARVRKGINILVSTPGRLLDHIINTASLELSNLRWLVIDEADRLMDMGFEKEVSLIIKHLDKRRTEHSVRQTILLSATLTSGVENMAGMCLRDHRKLEINDSPSEGNKNPDVFTTPENLSHFFTVVPSKLRLVTLFAFIVWKCKYSTGEGKLVIFMSTQDMVEFHYHLFQVALSESKCSSEIALFNLHGSMGQKERTNIFKEFSSTKAGVLLCTDVAARGLNLPNVKWIVQYTVPNTPTDYIHRAGRTARAGSHGQALVFLLPHEVSYVKTLNENNISIEDITMDDILKTLTSYVKESCSMSGIKQVPRSVEECAGNTHRSFEKIVDSQPSMQQLAKKAYLTYIRAYSTYPSHLKNIFHIKKLHIGHVVKSFGLNDAPSRIGRILLNIGKKKLPKKKQFATE